MPRTEQTVAYGTETVLPSTALTLPMFVAGLAKISNSVYKQTALFGVVIGDGAASTHTESVVIGRFASTTTGLAGTSGGIAIGLWATANSVSGISIGNGANTSSGPGHGIAIGYGATTSAAGSQYRISIGYQAGTNTTSAGTKNIAIGYQATGSGAGNIGIAIGDRASAGNIRATAIGAEANASHQNAVCIGYRALSTQTGEVVFGDAGFGAVTLISFRPAAGTPVRHRVAVDGWALRDVGNANDIFKVDESAVADDMRLLLWDVTAGALVRVTRGVAGSGGGATRLLRVPD